MNISFDKLIISSWILIALGVDLWLGLVSFTIAYVLSTFTDGSYPVCIGVPATNLHIAYPYHRMIIYQGAISLTLLSIGLVWSSVVLLISESLVVGFEFSRSQNVSYGNILSSIARPIGVATGMMIVTLCFELSLWTTLIPTWMGKTSVLGVLLLVILAIVLALFLLRDFLQFLSSRFSSFSKILFRIALWTVTLGVSIGNISLILQQIHLQQTGNCFTH